MFMPALGLIRWMRGAGSDRLAGTPEGNVAGLVGRITRYVRTSYRYRRALWELNSLDDRDLDDLALGRGDLPGLAWKHVQAA